MKYKIYRRVQRFREIILIFKSGLSTRCSAWFQDIKIGAGTKFWGHANLKKEPGTFLEIGKYCRFRSTHTSNLIGVNRPCIISVQGPEKSRLSIGNNCGFSGTVIGCFLEVTIGNDVMCGANTLITDSNWHPNDKRSDQPKPVIIEDHVWLGVNVTVLKGVRIGKNAVIGANSVVTKNIPNDAIAAGNPCVVIRIQKNEET